MEMPPSSPHSWLQAAQAESKLAAMDCHEELARCAEQASFAVLQQAFAESYQRVIGVWPQQRHQLRAVLENIRQGGPEDVKAAIADAGHLHSFPNGFFLGGD